MTEPRRRLRVQPEPADPLTRLSETVNRLSETVIRIETKLDTVISGHADHERRLRVLERIAYGALALGGTGALSGLWAALGG